MHFSVLEALQVPIMLGNALLIRKTNNRSPGPSEFLIDLKRPLEITVVRLFWEFLVVFVHGLQEFISEKELPDEVVAVGLEKPRVVLVNPHKTIDNFIEVEILE